MMDETGDHFQIRLVDRAARGRYVSGYVLKQQMSVMMSRFWYRCLDFKKKGSDGADFLLMFVTLSSSKINMLPIQKVSRIR